MSGVVQESGVTTRCGTRVVTTGPPGMADARTKAGDDESGMTGAADDTGEVVPKRRSEAPQRSKEGRAGGVAKVLINAEGKDGEKGSAGGGGGTGSARAGERGSIKKFFRRNIYSRRTGVEKDP